MKLWRDFYDYILPDLPGVETSLVDVWLRDKAIDFCEQTWCLPVDLDTTNTDDGVYEYSLDSVEPQTEAFAIKAAWINSEPIAPESMENLWKANRDWRTYQGKPLYFAQRDFQNVLLYPVPDDVYQFDCVVAVRPTLTSVGVPDRMFSDYRRVLVAGTKGELMLQPDKPWSNPTVGKNNMTEYNAGITQATVLTNRARSRATLQVRFRTGLA